MSEDRELNAAEEAEEMARERRREEERQAEEVYAEAEAEAAAAAAIDAAKEEYFKPGDRLLDEAGDGLRNWFNMAVNEAAEKGEAVEFVMTVDIDEDGAMADVLFTFKRKPKAMKSGGAKVNLHGAPQEKLFPSATPSDPADNIAERVPCPACHGSPGDRPCPVCDDQGTVPAAMVVEQPEVPAEAETLL